MNKIAAPLKEGSRGTAELVEVGAEGFEFAAEVGVALGRSG